MSRRLGRESSRQGRGAGLTPHFLDTYTYALTNPLYPFPLSLITPSFNCVDNEEGARGIHTNTRR